jgi:D-amino-acid dehydrogenase
MNPAPSHIVIVGGGIVGACCAWELARAGARVTLLESGEIGRGCSYGAAGVFSFGHLPIPQPGVLLKGLKWMWRSDKPLYIPPRFDPRLISWLWAFRRSCTPAALERAMKLTGDLSRISVGAFESLADDHHVDYDLSRGGYFEVASSQDGFAEVRAAAKLTARHGVKAETLSAADLRDEEPAFGPELVGAAWYPESVSGDPFKLTVGITRLAEEAGAHVRTAAPVQALLLDDHTVRGVRLQSGETLEAPVVVLAAGVWSASLAQQAGLHLPMQAAKGYHADVDHPSPRLTRGCVMKEAGMAAAPMNGVIRLGGTLEFSGVNEHKDPRRVAMLQHGARRYLPTLTSDPPRADWVGMRPCLPDGMPAIGWTRHARGLMLATGHAMLGVTFGPATGRIVRETILAQTPSIDMTGLSPDRFQ